MTPQIEQHIKRELLAKRTFALPGIGLLKLNREAAKFSDDKSTIYPPNFHVQFSEQKGCTYVGNYSNEINTISKDINDQLAQGNKAKIKGIGIFQKENNKLNFYPEKEFENSFSMGLEPLHGIVEPNKTFAGTPKIVAETLVTQKPKKDYSELYRYLKIAAFSILGIGLLYALLNIPIPTSDNTPKINPIKVTKPEDVKRKMDSIRVADSLAAIQVAIDDSIKAAAAENETLIKAQEEKETTKVESIKEQPSKNINRKKPNNSKNIDVTIPVTKIDTNEISRLTGKPCAVITGWFKSSTFAIRMVKKLQRLGYKVYTEESGGGTRVGVLYNCQKTDANKLLSEIKIKVDSTSWILQ